MKKNRTERRTECGKKGTLQEEGRKDIIHLQTNTRKEHPMKLFSDDMPFLRGNLHTHTTMSDGKRTPAEAMWAYREAGYDFLAITDHRKLTVPDPSEIPEGLIWIPGTELDYFLPHQVCHVVGLGIREGIENLYSREGTPQDGIDAIRTLGGKVVLAHPAWSVNTTDFMLGLKGVDATEIWNSVSAPPYNANRPDSSAVLDPVFAAGCLWKVLASDDTHFYQEEFARGWTMVQTEDRTPEGILKEILEGKSYATQGPVFYQIEVRDREVTVRTSPCSSVIFYSNLAWAKGRTVLGEGLTEVTWTCPPKETYVRVELTDAMGRRAWSNPLPVE